MISKKRKSGYIKPEITNFMIQNEGFICTSASVDGLQVGDYENGGLQNYQCIIHIYMLIIHHRNHSKQKS